MSTRLNDTFCTMRQRCYNPNNPKYKDYGARGITICSEWYTPGSHKGWRAFKKWALENGYSDDLTIDRIDNEKGYSPKNCRWTTPKIQSNNKRDNHIITYKGKTQTLALWCEELGLKYGTIATRIDYYHWSVERAFEQKIRRKSV